MISGIGEAERFQEWSVFENDWRTIVFVVDVDISDISGSGA